MNHFFTMHHCVKYFEGRGPTVAFGVLVEFVFPVSLAPKLFFLISAYSASSLAFHLSFRGRKPFWKVLQSLVSYF